MLELRQLADKVKDLALEVGFSRAGITGAAPIDMPGRLRRWLEKGYCAGMSYMAANLDKRLNPALLVEGARSVICLAVGYAPPADQCSPQGAFVARYARGPDYHKVLRRRCLSLMDRIRRLEPGFRGRAFVDSGPVAERTLAAQAGIGFIARNACLVAPGLGSYVLLCEIVCNLPLPPDRPLASACENCRKCQHACPTGALAEGPALDARKCISYLTIEHRGAVARELWPKMGTCVFGCDACQQACPHNRNAPVGDAELVCSRPALCGADAGGILAWRQEDWDRATRGSATRRASFDMLLRNAIIAAGNSAASPADENRAVLADALRLVCRRSAELAAAAEWALERFEEARGPEGSDRPDRPGGGGR